MLNVCIRLSLSIIRVMNAITWTLGVLASTNVVLPCRKVEGLSLSYTTAAQ